MYRPDPRLAHMRGDVPGTIWPPLFSSRIASLGACVTAFDRTQWLDEEEIVAGQYRQLALLAAHFEQHSLSFRDRLKEAGLTAAALGTPEGLRSLAPLVRRQVQAADPPLHVETLPEGHKPAWTITTSGSTGEPVMVRRTAINRLHWLALSMRYHLWAEPDFRGRICSIRALTRPGIEKDWGPPVSLFFPTGPGLKIDIESDIPRQVELLREFRPNSLIIYPSNLAALLDEIASEGVSLPDLERVRTIGETLPPELREDAAERIGASVFDCYSSEEFGYIAIQCPESGLYHSMAETLIVEVVDEEGRPCGPGETGRVLVTDIHNHATPMIRYEIGDLAEAGPPCSCGRGLPTLARILGRERNIMIRPDGTRHWPLTGYKKYREIAPIIQYQMRQHAPDRIEMRLVVERPLRPDEEQAFRESLYETLRYPFTIDLTYYEGRLPTGPNGKFEEFLRLF